MVGQIQGWNGEGKLITGYQMRDGSSFWDTNNNGKMDLHLMTAPDGSVWQNDGDGWRQVSGAA
jgi:hypothetical protein